MLPAFQVGSRGRVVKATDSKSVSLWERRFESYQLRYVFGPAGHGTSPVLLPPICPGQNLMLQVRLELTTPAYLLVYCL